MAQINKELDLLTSPIVSPKNELRMTNSKKKNNRNSNKLRQQRGLELPYTGGLKTEHDHSPTKRDEKHGKLDDSARQKEFGSAKSQKKQVTVMQQ